MPVKSKRSRDPTAFPKPTQKREQVENRIPPDILIISEGDYWYGRGRQTETAIGVGRDGHSWNDLIPPSLLIMIIPLNDDLLPLTTLPFHPGLVSFPV